MNINITGKDYELTDSIKDYANEKIGKLEKYLGSEFDAAVTFKSEGKQQVAEVRITASGVLYKATSASHDLYVSIDKSIEILEGQIRKNKTKKDKQNMTESIRLKSQNSEEDLDNEGEIVKTIAYSIKPITEEDAKLILESDVKNKFLPFIDANTNEVKVIYKLKDGKNFGLLEPEA